MNGSADTSWTLLGKRRVSAADIANLSHDGGTTDLQSCQQACYKDYGCNLVTQEAGRPGDTDLGPKPCRLWASFPPFANPKDPTATELTTFFGEVRAGAPVYGALQGAPQSMSSSLPTCALNTGSGLCCQEKGTCMGKAYPLAQQSCEDQQPHCRGFVVDSSNQFFRLILDPSAPSSTPVAPPQLVDGPVTQPDTLPPSSQNRYFTYLRARSGSSSNARYMVVDTAERTVRVARKPFPKTWSYVLVVLGSLLFLLFCGWLATRPASKQPHRSPFAQRLANLSALNT